MQDIDISKMSIGEVANLYVEEKQAELLQRGLDRAEVEKVRINKVNSDKELTDLQAQVKRAFH